MSATYGVAVKHLASVEARSNRIYGWVEGEEALNDFLNDVKTVSTGFVKCHSQDLGYSRKKQRKDVDEENGMQCPSYGALNYS